MLHKFILVCILTVSSFSANAQDDLTNHEGDYLYRVTAIRFAPGKFKDFLEFAKEVEAGSYFEIAKDPRPMLMRHSQGDQWDILKIDPMGSWSDYHSKKRTKAREKAAKENISLLSKGIDYVAFAEDHFAYGPPLEQLRAAYAQNSFYHIEMFHAVAGKHGELLTQRRMENEYLKNTGQIENMIFRRASGSDVDVFTIGFHESLQAFAEPAPVSVEEKEIAAKEAGFKDLADISFYLRSLISSHHDTLAGKVE